MSTSDFQYSIAQCDVSADKRASLESYRAKRTLWLGWLDNDEHHAIWTAISSLVWTDVSFRTLSKIALDNPTSSLRNRLMTEQLINGHVATQVLAIRRLVDNRRDVISLRRLIKDIRSNFHLFTRENYACFDGLPYDYETVMQKQMPDLIQSGPTWMPTAGPDAWSVSKMLHEQFDRLSGVKADKRQRDDRLPISLLDKIEGWLNQSEADELADWSHAYLAHAGNVESRERIAAAQVTNNKITNAIKSIARVTEAISAYVLYASGRMNSLMPTAQFDQFEHLDQTIMSAAYLGTASQTWWQLSNERDSFMEDVRDELTASEYQGK